MAGDCNEEGDVLGGFLVNAQISILITLPFMYRMDNCPSCERQFEWMGDFPLVYVKEVSLVKPENVPSSVPSLRVSGYVREEGAPREVVDSFRAEPLREEVAHSDGFVYSIYKMLGAACELGPVGVTFAMHKNLAPHIRGVLEHNDGMRAYLHSLEDAVGREVSRAEVIPAWEQIPFIRSYVFAIPDERDVQLAFAGGASEFAEGAGDRDKGLTTLYFSERSRGDPGPLTLIQIGNIAYEGRVRNR